MTAVHFRKCLLFVLVLSLIGNGCKKNAKAPATSPVEAKLEAIRQAGYPVTLVEFNAWYVEPPAGQNGATLYRQAFDALVSSKTSNAPPPLKENSETLRLLHQAASQNKQSRYPVDLTKGLVALLPHLAKLKGSSRLLKEAAITNVAQGRMDSAVECVLDNWRLAESLKDEPILISLLVRIAAENLMKESLEEAITRKPFSDAQLSTLRDVLKEGHHPDAVARALAGERCMAVNVFQSAPNDQLQFMMEENQVPAGFDFSTYRKSATGDADFAFLLDRVEEYIVATSLPFPKGLDAAIECSRQVNEAKSKGFYVSASFLPALEGVLDRSADAIARLRVTQAALAIERYRLANENALPESLSGLTPQFLTAVPADPFDGKPLRYTKTSPKGYVVYSIGRDRKDDGGKAKQASGSIADITFTVRR